jgi:hypothetical protein
MQTLLSWSVSGLALALMLAGAGRITWNAPKSPAADLPKVRGDCQSCHPNEAKDWAESRHAAAWESESFAQTSRNRTLKMCLPCHAPEPILVKGFGEHPALREDERPHGIDCISCHQDANNAYHGTLGTKTDAHATVKNEKFGTVDMCATCHEIFGTVDWYKQSEWGKDPNGCVNCHMPVVERPIATGDGLPARKARVHKFEGATPEMFQKGVKMSHERRDDYLQIKLESVWVGHTVPTGPEYVVVIVEARFMNGEQEVGKHQTLLADNVAIDGNDTRLKPGERRVIRAPIPNGAQEAIVRVLHKRNREWSDDKARVLYEAKVAL